MNAIIIEDEYLAATELEVMLKEVAPDIKIEVKLDSVADSVKWLKKNRTDLIFMDIHLGDGQSFDIFEQVEVNVPVIFITAYDEYALKAFKYQGIDYILKPFDKEELQRALSKLEALRPDSVPFPAASLSVFQERFLVTVGAKMRSIAVQEVAYFMADGKYLILFTRDGQNYILDQTISGIETKLNPLHFFKINRKFIINFAAIKEMIRYSNSRIKIILSPLPPDGIESIVSTDRIQEFKQWLNR
ncbi:LytTR family DNA-binding domain-containing protein [uncultured Sanguibacteroides sp.]|uniref:LytR/AlgR family response regulator transcription factor n=1 Tax=uncultured Sanguibacteroides sp. TaxID=1635151 RepID=UPI0025D8E590|nr:LytTR family DNA-binding domain-containing protein [uncultured Sanguibacteroides sp.]